MPHFKGSHRYNTILYSVVNTDNSSVRITSSTQPATLAFIDFGCVVLCCAHNEPVVEQGDPGHWAQIFSANVNRCFSFLGIPFIANFTEVDRKLDYKLVCLNWP